MWPWPCQVGWSFSRRQQGGRQR
uniref:Uncharacterized protein n=1 Tax=Arundo donax TaxID=35708 RepID=A0A0A8YPK5_ARUDO